MTTLPPQLAALSDEIVGCHACPRLVAWRELVAVEKRASFRDEVYWGRPVPGFGDPSARIVVVGLAPAAHGANRTGRVFTGDRSGDWLFAAMHRAGVANQPTSTALDDGLELRDAYVMAAVRCAPPDNKPTIDERNTCAPFMTREFELLDQLQVYVALGSFAFDAVLRADPATSSPKPKFGHGVQVRLASGRLLIASFHPSQQNTFTKRLTEPMFDAVFAAAVEHCT